jgi:hypothetical protein
MLETFLGVVILKANVVGVDFCKRLSFTLRLAGKRNGGTQTKHTIHLDAAARSSWCGETGSAWYRQLATSHTVKHSFQLFHSLLGLFPTLRLVFQLVFECIFPSLGPLPNGCPLSLNTLNDFLCLLLPLLHHLNQTLQTICLACVACLLLCNLTGESLYL